MNPIRCISINHRTAPVSTRERLLIRASDAKEILADGVEIYVLCTCNRTEVYWVETDEKGIWDMLCRRSGLDAGQLMKLSETYSGQDAVKHLFMVASGLDSLVLGEPQILGQVKEAYREALALKTTSVYLNKALHRAFRAAKRVRTETNIGNYPVSVASEAVELACHIFDDITKSSVLMVGAGEMAEIAGKRLKGNGVSEITVINRTYENACSLSKDLGGVPKPFEALKAEIALADIIITSTGSPEPIITSEMMARAMKQRKNREVIIIDIAVPRDVEPEVGKLYNCYLYDIDALKSIVERHFSKRALQTGKAMEIIDYEADVFGRWLAHLDAQETIKDLYNLVDSYAKDQSETLLIPDGQRPAFEKALSAGLKRLLHRPVSFLKDHPGKEHIESVRRLFKLDEDHKDRHKG